MANPILENFLSKETNQHNFQETLRGIFETGSKKVVLDFKTDIGLVLTQNDKPLIEAFINASNRPVTGTTAGDVVPIKDIKIKRGKAIVRLGGKLR